MPAKVASLIAWANPDQVGLLRAIALEADLAIVGAGWNGSRQSGSVAGMLNAKPIDDLRQALVDPKADEKADLLLILTKPELDFAQIPPTTLKIATLEPIPDSALAPVAGDWSPASTGPRTTPVHFIPLVRFGDPVRNATEHITAFGEVGAFMHESLGMQGEGSLGAHLFGAMDLVHLMMGEPDSIDAMFVPMPGAAHQRAVPGETLANLSGTITASMRFPGRRGATIVVSNCASRWSTTTTLLGAGGRMRFTSDGSEWLDASGKVLDDSLKPKRKKVKAVSSLTVPLVEPKPLAEEEKKDERTPLQTFSQAYVEAVAKSLRRLVDNTLFPEPPGDVTTALAMGQAALLSCRTGQPESPATIRRMIGVGSG
jgi:hypothetical protein